MREKETTQLRKNAKRLRSDMTEAEWALWYHLRTKRFCGIKSIDKKLLEIILLIFFHLILN